MNSYASRRFTSFIISILMILGSFSSVFAVEKYLPNEDRTEVTKGIDKKTLEEKYPLSNAYLNREIGTAVDKSERIYVVQFEDSHADGCLKKIQEIPGIEIKYHYDSIFKGVSIKLRADKISQVRDMEGVKNIQENGTFVPQMSSAKQITRIKEAVSYYEELIKDLPESERKAKQLDGRGTVVAVIDSGIDINHESMRIDDDAKPFMKIKKHPGFTDKVPFGFSYVGGGPNLMDNVVAGHGMHCAGIIAGNSDKLKGVVPNAQILSYRIFSDAFYGDNLAHYEYGGDDAVYHAIDDAVKKGADVISMSIGQAGNGYAGDIYYETVNRAADQGVVIVSAIGNYGSAASDNTFDTNPNIDMDVMDFSAMTYYAGIGRMLAVGAATNTSRMSRQIQIGDDFYPYVSFGSIGENEKVMDRTEPKLEFVYLGHGRETAYRGLDVRGKVVLVVRDGSRTKGSKIVEKIQEAQKRGAKGIIIMNAPIAYSRDNYLEYPIISYMNDPSMAEIISNGNMWAISVNGKDGQKIRELCGKGALDVRFPKDEVEVSLADSIRLAGFSGWGPNAELELKPEVVAPGENIYSSMNRNRYGFMSGTSMATPHVAGISAMMVHKIRDILKKPYFNQMKQADINKIMLMNTADPIKDAIKTDLEVSPRRQGAGMVRADKAIKNEVLLSHNKKGAVELKDFDEDQKTFKIRIDNISNENRTYKLRFSDVIGQGVITQSQLLLKADKIRSGQFEDEFDLGDVKVSVPDRLGDASIKADRNEINIPGRSHVEVEVTLDTKARPEGYFVEGYIYFESKDENIYPSLSMPYLGFRGDWQSGPIIDKPMWDKDSIYKHTTVVGVYADDGHGDDIKYKILGVDKEAFPTTEVIEHGVKKKKPDERFLKDGYMVDPDKIAFGIGFMASNPKEVALRMVALREVKDLEVAIVNSEKQVVRVLSRSQNYRKQIRNVIFESTWQANVYNRPNILTKWDGKIYNPKKPKDHKVEYGDGMVGAPSGQYYYRIRAKVKDTDAWEETFLPVRLDNTQPVADVDSIKYTMSQDGKSRDISFKLKDDHGLMFVGASLDNKPIEVKKLGADEYLIEGLAINELTQSRLHIEAMDYATNLMDPIDINLNNKFMEIENYKELLSCEADKLIAKLDNHLVVSLEAYQDGKELRVIRDNNKFEIKLEGQGDLQIIGKDKDGNVIGEKTLVISSASDSKLKSEDSQKKEFGPIDYVEDLDEDSANYRNAFDYGMLNYYILGQSSPNIDKIGDQNYFNPTKGWYPSFKSDYSSRNYRVRITAYNTLYSNYDVTYEKEWDLSNVEHKPNIPVYDGTNILNITVVNKKTGKIVFSRGVLVMYDSQAPVLTIDSGNVSEKDKKIYANSNKLLVSGKIEDNLDEVYLRLNGDNVVTRLKQGDFAGDTSGTFEAIINVEDGDMVSFKANDRFGNYKDTQYTVVMDTENPSIDIDEYSIDGNTVLEPIIRDNEAIRESIILVNGKPYEQGKKLSEYGIDGKYNIEITAIDKAGNKTVKSIELGLTDEDKQISGVTISKQEFRLDELDNFKEYINLPEGISYVSHSEIRREVGRQEVLVKVSNQYGHIQSFTFEIRVIEDEDIVEDIGEINLMKKDLLPEQLTIDNMFGELPSGVIAEMDPVDADKPGEKQIRVTFRKGNLVKTVEYTINILPELDVELNKTRILLDDLGNINNLVKKDERFNFSYKKQPVMKTGSQDIEILIEDDYGNSKEVNFAIEVYAKDKPTPRPNPTPNPRPSEPSEPYLPSEPYVPSKPYRPSEPKKPKLPSIEEPKYEPVAEAKEDDYKRANTIQPTVNKVVNDIEEHWAKPVIEKAIAESIVSGYPDGTFKPNNKTSRSEFVALANRVFKLKGSKVANFGDVKFGDWYYKDLRALVEAGIVKGDENNKFNPNEAITREQVLYIFVKYIEKERPELLNTDMKDLTFADNSSISPWAREEVRKAYSLGLIMGDDNNMLNSGKEATRAEVVKMIYNLKDLLDK